MSPLNTGFESIEESDRNDQIVEATIRLLSQENILTYKPFNGNSYRSLYETVNTKFEVSESSITTRMARLLFGISDAVCPKSILVVGSYLANSLVWLASPVLSSSRIVGVDIDDGVNERARKNLLNIGFHSVEIVNFDGHLAGELFPDRIDLLLLDADSVNSGKKIYRSLLKSLLPFLGPEALVLAHDVCYKKFENDLVLFMEMVNDHSIFRKTVKVCIDSFGLGVSKR